MFAYTIFLLLSVSVVLFFVSVVSSRLSWCLSFRLGGQSICIIICLTLTIIVTYMWCIFGYLVSLISLDLAACAWHRNVNAHMYYEEKNKIVARDKACLKPNNWLLVVVLREMLNDYDTDNWVFSFCFLSLMMSPWLFCVVQFHSWNCCCCCCWCIEPNKKVMSLADANFESTIRPQIICYLLCGIDKQCYIWWNCCTFLATYPTDRSIDVDAWMATFARVTHCLLNNCCTHTLSQSASQPARFPW